MAGDWSHDWFDITHVTKACRMCHNSVTMATKGHVTGLARKVTDACTHLKMVLMLTTLATRSQSSQAMRSINGTILSSVL